MAGKVLPKKPGRNTDEYLIVKEHFSILVAEVVPNLSVVAVKFFSCSLIPTTEVQNVNSDFGDPYRKASGLMMVVLSAIEHDPSKLSILVSALKNVGLSAVASKLAPVVEEHSGPTGEANEVHLHLRDTHSSCQSKRDVSFQAQSSSTSREVQHRDSSDSGVILKSESADNEVSTKDSAYSDSQSSFTIEGNRCGGGDEIVNSNNSELIKNSTSSVNANSGEIRGPEEQSLVGLLPENNTANEMVTLSSNRYVLLKPGSEAYIRQHQYQYDIATLKDLVKKQKAEFDSMKNAHDLKESELSKLQEEMCKMAEESKMVMKDKDDTIEKLTIDLKNSCELVERLRGEKANVEARMADLKKAHEEALKNQKRAEERAVAVEKEFKETEELLLKQLEELREKEEKAQLELQTIKTKLAEANCIKLKELQELKDRNHELEKSEIRLQAEVEKRELAKDKELAEKEAQLMKTEKELAEKEAQLLMKTERELAESRQKCLEVEVEALRKQLEKQCLQKDI